jgi:hypothetical protein
MFFSAKNSIKQLPLHEFVLLFKIVKNKPNGNKKE